MRATCPRLVALLSLLLVAGGCPADDPVLPDGSTPDTIYPDVPPFVFPEAGDLLGMEPPPAGSDRCAGAVAVTLSGGKALIKGTTTGAANEFSDKIRCGGATPLAGPPRYYRLTLTGDVIHRLQLKPQFEAVLYLFNECSANLINVDCVSGGSTGLFSGVVAKGSAKTLFFEPPASGAYYLAVDSAKPAEAGAFELQVEALGAAPNSSCQKAQPLQLTGGKVTVTGTTLGSKNEFSNKVSCSMWQAFLGPQLYYRVPLTKGSWYRLALSPQFPAALYVSRASAGCTGTDVDTDCGSITGTVVPKIPAGGLGATAYSPSFSGDHLVAVDSLTAAAAGAFSLTIESYTPTGNMLCGSAKALQLSSTGSLTLTDTTAGALNDLGAHVKCGTSTALVAPQRYYTVPLQQRSYELWLKPAFPATLAVGQSCLLLPNNCGSGGLTGTQLQVAGGQIGSKVFAAPKAGTYVLAVDSSDSQAAGAFELQLKEHAAPTHGACASPRVLKPSTSPLVELGDTSPLKNDLTGISCGGASPWPGPQAYFKVALKGGTSYTVKLRPEPGFDPALYAFPAATSCAAKAINAACAGHASDVVGAGKPEDLTLAPTSDADWVLVVDAWSASEVGKFALSVSW